MLNSIKNILRISTVIFALGIGSAQAVQNPQYSGIHGSACQPIFLQQALDLGLKWTRQGVLNDNPLGSGVFFWVACPVSWTDDGSAANNSDINVHIFYNDRDGSAGTRTFCFAMRQDSTTHVGGTLAGQIGSRPGVTDPNGGSGPAAYNLQIFDIIKSAQRSFHGNTESLVVACKLYPQAGVRAMSLDFD